MTTRRPKKLWRVRVTTGDHLQVIARHPDEAVRLVRARYHGMGIRVLDGPERLPRWSSS